jgi:HEPN domain-containing protein
MSYDEFDSAQDEMYERLSAELYSEHKEQAIAEFTSERLRSYYLENPQVAQPAVKMLHEAEALLSQGHIDAALVFAASSCELFLKATLLRPVIHGLVHSEVLAKAIVNSTLAQTGLLRYKKLLGQLFEHLTSKKLETVMRKGAKKPLLEEIREIQEIRNDVVHQGCATTQFEAERALNVCRTAVAFVLSPLLAAVGLESRKGEGIRPIKG